MGHIGECVTRAISKYLGWMVVQSLFKPCTACARAKIKRKAVVADRDHEVGNQITSQRVFVDISSAKTKGPRPAHPYWLIIVEKEMQAKFSVFWLGKETCQKNYVFSSTGER